MVIVMLLNKIHRLFLSILGVFRRALCCFRKRSRSNSMSDSEALTHVISNRESEEANWEWNDQPREPKTVQDHIELYRKKKQEALQTQESAQEDNLNFFEDMTPKITRQTKLYLGADQPKGSYEDRLSVGNVAPVEIGELQEWEESGSGWEGQTLDGDAQEALRMKKRQDHERRLWELQQKRLEKNHRSLGARVGT